MNKDAEGHRKVAMSNSNRKSGSNRAVGKRLLTTRETAEYLGLAEETVYKKARLRELPSVKVGRSLRFDLQALERYVEKHTIQTLD